VREVAVSLAIVLAVGLSALVQPETNAPVNVCVGADRVLRLVDAKESCGPGQRRLLLEHAKPEMDEAKKPLGGDDPAAAKSPGEARVRTLEEQVKQLQRELVRSRDLEFKLPFVLMDSSGKPAVTITQTPAGPLMQILANGRAAVEMGFGPRGNARMAVLTPGGVPAAVMGVGPEGIAAVQVYTKGGQLSAALQGDGAGGATVGVSRDGRNFLAALGLGDKGGSVVVRNDAAAAVAALQLGSNGTGGNVTLYDAAGRGVFSAGNATGGWGEACVTRQTGRTHCLGIGLPGMGVGR
jgi:hypothetical protein